MNSINFTVGFKAALMSFRRHTLNYKICKISKVKILLIENLERGGILYLK